MKNRKLSKVLIANRGEIAMRVQRAAQALEIESVSIASEADRHSFHAREASELVVLPGSSAADTYLNIDSVLEAALSKGCDCVHPGYGFLSENAEFAKAVAKAGMTFIGPTPEAIETLGSKTAARAAVRAHGVPCVPGVEDGLSDEQFEVEAQKIGFPAILKAVGGGGGRGMRVVRDLQALREALPLTRAEAKKNFGNDRVYLEKYIDRPRHVEVQVFGDEHGNVIHFGTRDCSTQRRHQKLVEEAPAPDLSEKLRDGIHQAAVNAAKSVGYSNAGTAEFLVDGDSFYFLEMNTRIQVEHPVSEEITGEDLVQLQFRVSRGEALPYRQDEVKFRGHSIEFRIYAEDPAAGFVPAMGEIGHLQHGPLKDYRADFSVESGDQVTPFYDAMLGKVIVTAESRSEAIEKSYNILSEYRVAGLASTLPFHRWLLKLSPFKQGPVDIDYVNRCFNAACLEQLEACELKDPLHQRPIGGAEVKTTYQYTSEKFGETYTIEVLHRRDGFFFASAVNSKGQRSRGDDCRMSNGLDMAMRSLISDVLEMKSPKELFED